MKTLPAWFGTNAPIVLPNGQIVDSGITLDEYESRVTALESEGCDRSDAQGIVDAQLLRSLELIPIGSNLPVNVCHESCAGDGGIPITLSFSIKCF